jgi:hypothetical protein
VAQFLNMSPIASSSFLPFKLGLHLGPRALYFETQLWTQTLQNGDPIVDPNFAKWRPNCTDQLGWDSNRVGSQCKAPLNEGNHSHLLEKELCSHVPMAAHDSSASQSRDSRRTHSSIPILDEITVPVTVPSPSHENR